MKNIYTKKECNPLSYTLLFIFVVCLVLGIILPPQNQHQLLRPSCCLSFPTTAAAVRPC